MKNLLAGIKSRFEDNATLRSAYTSLALTQTEDEVSLPYAVISYSMNVPTHCFGGSSNRIDRVEVMIDLWHTSAATLAGHGETLDEVFDHKVWPMSPSGTVVGCLLQSRSGPRYEGETEANGPIYRLASTYRFFVDLT